MKYFRTTDEKILKIGCLQHIDVKIVDITSTNLRTSFQGKLVHNNSPVYIDKYNDVLLVQGSDSNIAFSLTYDLETGYGQYTYGDIFADLVDENCLEMRKLGFSL